MSYRIKTHGRIGVELQRVAEQEIAAAVAELQSLDRSDLGEAVHEARKHFKKLRALVQLLREPLGAKCVRAEQAFYRDTGREFQRLRDAQALIATLEKLARRFFEQRRPPIIAAAHRVLAAEAQRAHRVLAKQGRWAAVVASLGEARGRIAAWKLDDYRWKDLRVALQRSYRRACEAWRHACSEPKPRALHNWRRRTKDFLYHITLCHSAAPDFMEELAGELEVLGEFLGDDHDLVILRALLEQRASVDCVDSVDCTAEKRRKGAQKRGSLRALPAGKAREAFFKMLALRREELLDAAFDLAGRIFLESPGEFIDALDTRRDEHRQRHQKVRRMAERLVARH